MGKRKKSVYEIVSAELQRLKEKLRDCQELTVVWTPKFQSSVHGEVKDTTIYIYEEDNQAPHLMDKPAEMLHRRPAIHKEGESS